ncbi:MAG: glycosyltransferase family 1 protein [Vulcanimicrobiaceae bacterium]
MRIGINLLFLIPGGVGGTEIYTRALVEALARNDDRNEYFVYRNRETEPAIVPNQRNFHDRPQPLHATIRPARIAYEQAVLPICILRDRIDVVVNCGITAPLLTPKPMITVFYDVQYKHYGRFLGKLEYLVTEFLFSMAAKRSAALITMTRSTESEIHHIYPFTRGKTFVVPHGVESSFDEIAKHRARSSSAGSSDPSPFLLAVSSLMAHKNFETLLHAFARLRSERPALRLIVAGIRGAHTATLEELCKKLGLERALRFTGWIPRGELLDLFRDASAFVFASKYEGFGIPVLEAMTAGVPLACSDIAVLREIAGEAALYFDPDDASSIAEALARLLDDENERMRLIDAGLQRARAFDWDVNVRLVLSRIRTFRQRSV